MLFRSKAATPAPSTATDAAASSEHADRDGKGRPTPKRKASEALNKRPLVPSDRKAAGKSTRTAARLQRDREYLAMQTGEEKYMPAKDRGPVRRYVRDHVDARWNLGEFFLPIAMVFVLSVFVFASNRAASTIVVLALYLVVLVTIIDAFIMWRGLKKRLFAKFGADSYLKGLAMYSVMRAFQIRRARLPKPQVKHGEFPA